MALQEGNTGQAVRDLQNRLRQAGYDPGQIDGIYGPQTANAVAQLQADYDLSPSGQADDDTLRVLATLVPQVPTPVSSQVATIQGLAQEFAESVGVDPLLVLSMIAAESRFKPRAHNLLTDAKGLMQLTPIAIRDLAQRFGVVVRDPYDIRQNIQGGVVFFKRMLDQFGQDVAQGLAAYHAGATRVEGWIRRYGLDWIAAAGRATTKYVTDVVNGWQAALGGGGTAAVTAVAFREPTFFERITEFFQPEVETIVEAVEGVEFPEISLPAIFPAAEPGPADGEPVSAPGFPTGLVVAGLGVLTLAILDARRRTLPA